MHKIHNIYAYKYEKLKIYQYIYTVFDIYLQKMFVNINMVLFFANN